MADIDPECHEDGEPDEHDESDEEEGEEDEDEEDDEDEDEEEEEEPILKYQRMGASLSQILMNDAASCLGVHEGFLTLGTYQGAVYVLDFHGNEIRRFHPHSKKVNDVSIEVTGEFVARCVLLTARIVTNVTPVSAVAPMMGPSLSTRCRPPQLTAQPTTIIAPSRE
jgi:hypothetical protein